MSLESNALCYLKPWQWPHPPQHPLSLNPHRCIATNDRKKKSCSINSTNTSPTLAISFTNFPPQMSLSPRQHPPHSSQGLTSNVITAFLADVPNRRGNEFLQHRPAPQHSSRSFPAHCCILGRAACFQASQAPQATRPGSKNKQGQNWASAPAWPQSPSPPRSFGTNRKGLATHRPYTPFQEAKVCFGLLSVQWLAMTREKHLIKTLDRFSERPGF